MTDYREIRSAVIYSAIVLATFFPFQVIVPQSAVKHQPPQIKGGADGSGEFSQVNTLP